ncbi:hypothetical protein FA048_07345 [Pedobacter polaris]|uniref:Outer membrane protein beta-barrel domain-containing protein n=1 Tax=Pedobacter polaris TaxID=2571273 RepID=A0A4U1CSK6_9SPHI|nr:outer membrane beta-barrel protein [Pedobacter polaris]TKC10015.1 hypothetical protein FA048_07345 [Pedobacter polaris]
MKKLLLSVLLLSSSITTFAQNNFKKSSAFIELGPSIPTGDFASKVASDEKAGLATTGFYFDLGYQYQFSKNVGAIAMFNWRINGIDKQALNYSLPTGSGGSMSVTTTTWRMASILGGLNQSFPLIKNEKLSIEFRELAGVQFSSSPEINVSYNIPGVGSSSGKQESSNATSFSYLLGLGFKYKLSNSLGLRLNADYHSSNPKFTVITYPADAPVEHKSEQKISTINVGVGLVIGF